MGTAIFYQFLAIDEQRRAIVRLCGKSIFAFTLDYAGGDYWLAWAYLYLVCGAFIFVGYMLLRHGYAGVAQPLVVVPVVLVVLIVLRVI